MTIKRVICGVEHEFQLSKEELREAFEEQEHLYDVSDVEAYFDAYDDDDIKRDYGRDRAEIESMFEKIACEMRRNIYKYDMDWRDAREAAIAELL